MKINHRLSQFFYTENDRDVLKFNPSFDTTANHSDNSVIITLKHHYPILNRVLMKIAMNRFHQQNHNFMESTYAYMC